MYTWVHNWHFVINLRGWMEAEQDGEYIWRVTQCSAYWSFISCPSLIQCIFTTTFYSVPTCQFILLNLGSLITLNLDQGL